MPWNYRITLDGINTGSAHDSPLVDHVTEPAGQR